MKIYAISDTHFNHARLIELGHRPENFQHLLFNNLKKVSGDLLIHCGDFCIGEDEESMKFFMEATTAFKKRILVRGNHDNKSDAWYVERGFDLVCTSFANRYYGKKIIFTHIPINPSLIKDSDHNIHGHMHGNTHRLEGEIKDYYSPGYHIDLAPEIRDYAPVSLEKILN